MSKYIITWDAGYGDCYEVIEAESFEKAEKYAYEMWCEDAENNGSYQAEEFSKELAEEYDIEEI